MIMKTKHIVLALGLFLLVITGIRFAWIAWQTPLQTYPKAVGGEIDLTDWSFGDNRSVPLSGEWTFYPYAFYMQSAAARALPDPALVRVPGSWRKDWPDRASSSYGYGSYRLLIHVHPDDNRLFGIRMPVVPTSSELYVNGRLLGGSGSPGTDKSSYTPRQLPYTVEFHAQEDTIEIVVQTANFDNKNLGGIGKPIRFGTEQAIDRETAVSQGMQLLVCAIFLMHAIYAFLLLFIRSRLRGLTCFFLLTVSAIVSILIDDDRLLLAVAPIDYEWSIRLVHWSYLGIAMFLFHYARLILVDRSRVSDSRVFNLIGVVLAVFIGIAPLHVVTPYGSLILPYLFFAVAAAPTMAFRAARRGDKSAIFLMAGGIAIATNTAWGVVKGVLWPELDYYPFDMIITALALAAYWFTRHIRSAEQSKQLAEMLQETDKRKDDFLAHTSHELRNPLHGMLTIAQTVLDDETARNDGKHRESLSLLISVGRRMSLLLNDLLDINRLKEKAVRIEPAPVRIQAVVSGVIDMLRYMTEGKPIRFENRLPDAFPAVYADENRLTQIMFNLLHNAVKFTPEGNIAIDAELRNGRARLTVTDTGIGMEEETLKRVFMPYEQADSAITAPGGLGLGLNICKQLVELHGGTIEAASAPNRGSAFTIELPLADDDGTFAPERFVAQAEAAAAGEPAGSPSAADAPVAQPSSSGSGIRILAVDDDPVNLRVLTHTLATEGFEIGTATSGDDALTMLDAAKWDAMIVDVMMPGMSGYELTRRVRQRYSLSELPILLLTARSRPEDIHSGFAVGANDYIAKPVDAMELKSRIRALTELTLSVRDRIRMEAAWLQAQIQPHFLFNTLNAIVSLGESDTERMRELANVFGVYLRASYDFHNSDKLVPLGNELELVQAYLFIEKERFGDRLQVQWEVHASSMLLVPPLSIQPLVENAVRHGVLKRQRGGQIVIRIAEDAGHVEVCVEDDGAGMDESTLDKLLERSVPRSGGRSGIGLINTDRRLKQLYGQGLFIESRPGLGTKVTFRVMK